MARVWRWSAQLGWRAMVLFGIAALFGALGYLLRTGASEESFILIGIGMVALLQAGAIARACMLHLQGVSYAELYEKFKTRHEEERPLEILYTLADLITVHPLLGILQPFLLMLMGLVGMVSGLGQVVVGPGLLHGQGALMVLASWLLIVVCWSALHFRLGASPLTFLARGLDWLRRRR